MRNHFSSVTVKNPMFQCNLELHFSSQNGGLEATQHSKCKKGAPLASLSPPRSPLLHPTLHACACVRARVYGYCGGTPDVTSTHHPFPSQLLSRLIPETCHTSPPSIPPSCQPVSREGTIVCAGWGVLRPQTAAAAVNTKSAPLSLFLILPSCSGTALSFCSSPPHTFLVLSLSSTLTPPISRFSAPAPSKSRGVSPTRKKEMSDGHIALLWPSDLCSRTHFRIPASFICHRVFCSYLQMAEHVGNFLQMWSDKCTPLLVVYPPLCSALLNAVRFTEPHCSNE